MVTIVKHEWHQVDRQYAYEMDEDILSEIYPDHDEDAIKNMLAGLADGSISIEDVLDEAQENDVDIDFKIEDCKFGNFDQIQVEAIFGKLEFNSLINRLQSLKN